MLRTFKRTYILTLITFLTLTTAGFNGGIASALTSNGAANGFTVSPVLTDITINKGASQTVAITVANPTSTTLIAEPIVNDFVASSDETGTPRLILKDNVPLPVNNFKSLVGNIPTTTLGPNKTAVINVTIAVPKAAESGGYYGAIRFIPGLSGNQANVGLTASVGSLFLITVPGNLNAKLVLSQFSAADSNGNPSSFFSNGQVSALVRLDDTGNIHTQPFGTITLKDMWGKTLSTTQFNDATPRSNVLPGSIRKFVTNLPSHKYLGRYTLTASFGYGTSGSNAIVATTSFWYIPLWAQILALIIIIAIVLIIYAIVHRIRSRRF